MENVAFNRWPTAIGTYRSIKEMKADKSKRPTAAEEIARQKDALKSLDKFSSLSAPAKVQAR